IIGTGGLAIDLSISNSDVLTFLPGSRIFGQILLGSHDTVNIQAGRDISQLLTFGTPSGVNGLVDTGSTVHVSGGLAVVNVNQVATLDPTTLALADRSLLDFTGGMSSLVQSRFATMASPTPSAGRGALAVSYAAEPAANV